MKKHLSAINAIYLNNVKELKTLKNENFDFTGDYLKSALLSCNAQVLDFFTDFDDFEKRLSAFNEEELAVIYIESVMINKSNQVKDILKFQIESKNVDYLLFENVISRFYSSDKKLYDKNKEVLKSLNDEGFDILKLSNRGKNIYHSIIKYKMPESLELIENLTNISLDFSKEEYTNLLFDPVGQFLEVYTITEERNAIDFVDKLISRNLPLTDIVIKNIINVNEMSEHKKNLSIYLIAMYESHNLKNMISSMDHLKKKRL